MGPLLSQFLAPALIGALTGACVAAASGLVEGQLMERLADLPGYLPALLTPLALLATWGVGRLVTGFFTPATSELYIHTYVTPGARLPLREVPGRLLAAVTTVGFGGSQGFESPSALIGAAWSQLLARWTRSEDTRRTLLAAGASAGIAAVFSSPAMGALYGIEVPYRRDVDAPRLAPCAIAAVSAYLVRRALVGDELLLQVAPLPPIDATYVAACAAVAICCGLGARLFAAIEDGLRAIGRRQTRFTRAAIGGAGLGLLAAVGFALSGAWITFGPGYVAADWLLREPHPLGLIGAVLAVRAAGNLICVYGGGGGGVFTSLACNGAFIGQLIAEAIGRGHAHLLPLLGAACFLSAGYRLPIAGMLWIGEQSGSVTISIAGLAAIAVSQLLMGEASVSEAQAEERKALLKKGC
ncbi:chloride channel protein [bacterium]|nr:chloride channel protein [bacterium]